VQFQLFDHIDKEIDELIHQSEQQNADKPDNGNPEQA
jgi:hypothetical protein